MRRRVADSDPWKAGTFAGTASSGESTMNVVAMLEASPDWIMLTNAITIKVKYNVPKIVMLGNTATDLSGLTDTDTLYLIGHASPTEAGDYSAVRLARILKARHLPETHRFISLPASCETAKVTTSGTFIGTLARKMKELGYDAIAVTGAVGLAISGWGVDQVVNPAVTDEYCKAEDKSIADNEEFITQAKAIAALIDVDSTSEEIVAAASKIAMKVEYFYENLALRTQPYLLPSGSGYRTVPS
jgi:hypothetical protein